MLTFVGNRDKFHYCVVCLVFLVLSLILTSSLVIYVA